MVIVGWTSDKHWIVLNSWGSFGRDGHGALYIDFREPRTTTISLSDDIVPIKRKCGVVELTIGRNLVSTANSEAELATSARQDIKLDVAPYINNNRTFVPVRFVADALGASVEWDAKTGTATLRSEENIIKLTTNSKWMQVSDYKPVVWKKIKMDTAPHIVNNRMMIPIRYIAENLNCDVEWDSKNARAIIKAK